MASVVSISVRPHRWKPTRLPRPSDYPGKNMGVGCHFLLQCMKVKSESEVAQSCQTLSNPMLVGEGHFQHWLKISDWQSPERSLELEPGEQPSNLYHQAQEIPRWLHWAIPSTFPKRNDWNKGTKLMLTYKHLMNLFIAIIINFGLFLKKILVFFQMLIPLV